MFVDVACGVGCAEHLFVGVVQCYFVEGKIDECVVVAHVLCFVVEECLVVE